MSAAKPSSRLASAWRRLQRRRRALPGPAVPPGDPYATGGRSLTPGASPSVSPAPAASGPAWITLPASCSVQPEHPRDGDTNQRTMCRTSRQGEQPLLVHPGGVQREPAPRRARQRGSVDPDCSFWLRLQAFPSPCILAVAARSLARNPTPGCKMMTVQPSSHMKCCCRGTTRVSKGVPLAAHQVPHRSAR